MNNHSRAKAVVVFFLSLLACSPALADQGIDARINAAIRPLTDALAGIVFASFPVAGVQIPFVLVWLIFAAFFLTFYFKFINIRAFKHAFDLVRGTYDHDPDAPGEITHFQALATALSGTVGLGNIAGVAVAVSLGGPGATFWMIVAGIFGMSSKFTECTLGVKYRNVYADGTVSGGPMYYLSKGLAERGRGFKTLGKLLAVMFAVFSVVGSFGAGSMFQANQGFSQLVNVTGGADSWLADKGWLFGIIIASLVGVVIIGGIKGIARVTSKLVPVMGVIYVLAGLTVIFLNYTAVPAAFMSIFTGAFTPEGISGGVVGVLFQGFRRSVFSNEAGIGSAAIAHSAVKTHRPVTEGLVALYEPFIDTVVICTITALVIIITNAWDPSIDTSAGIALTSSAFASVMSWFPWVLSIAVLLFAFSTMLAVSYYGLKSWTYLFGEGRFKETLYKMLFLFAVAIGASMQLGVVIEFSDAMLFGAAFPNLLGCYLLLPVVKRELNEYWADYKAGKLTRTR